MRRFTKLLAVISTVAILSTGLLSCSSKPKDSSSSNTGPVTLRFSWWGSDARNQATLDVINQYKKIAPNVTIDGEITGVADYPTKMKTQLAAGMAADIIQSDIQWTDDLNRMGSFFVDLNKYKDILDTKGFDANFLKAYCIQSNKLTSLPTGINALTCIFNSAILQKSGINPDQNWNWDTIISEGIKVNQTDKNQYFLCLGQTALQEVLRSYIRQKTGQQLIKDDYTLGFTKSDLVSAFSYEKELFDSKILQPADISFSFNLQSVMMDPSWNNSQFGGTIDLTSVMGGIIGPFKSTVDVGNFPIATNAKQTAIVVKPAQIVCINNKSKYPQECAKFLNFFFNDKNAILTLKDNRSIQPTQAGQKDCTDANVVNPSISKAVSLAMAKQGVAENGISRNAEVITIFVSDVEKIGYGNMTPDQASDDMITQLQAKLKELKP
jgi:oligogalacturonide transport system substrate-binding protein